MARSLSHAAAGSRHRLLSSDLLLLRRSPSSPFHGGEGCGDPARSMGTLAYEEIGASQGPVPASSALVLHGLLGSGRNWRTFARHLVSGLAESSPSPSDRVMVSSNPLFGILEANMLTGPNYSDWFRNLKIFLTVEKIVYVLEADMPELGIDASDEDIAIYNKWQEDATLAKCYMLASMSNELQRQYEKMCARAILKHLKELFEEQSRTERYEISKNLFRARMLEGSSVQAHVLKMIQWIEKLSELGFVINHELSVDLVLQSLPDSYSSFVMNFYMNNINMSLAELFNMLKSVEANIKKEKEYVMLIGQTTTNKKRKSSQTFKKGKGKKNQYEFKKAKKEPQKKEKGECFYCHVKGHWKRNCKVYFTEKTNEKFGEPSGIYKK